MKESELPENLRGLWLKGLSAIELKNFDYAISLLLPVVSEAPEFLDGRKMLRNSAIEKKKGKKSLFNFSSKGFSGMKVKGLVQKDPKKAMALIEENLKDNPFDIDANQMLFDSATALHLPDTAAFALETIIKGHPKNTRVMHQLAEHYMAQDQPNLASKIYNQIIKVDPADLEAVKGSKDADARESMKKNKLESGSMRDWIKDKDLTEELEKQGRAGMTKDQLQERLAKLNEKFEQEPNNSQLASEIAGICDQLEDYQNAISFYQWAFDLSSNDSSLERKVRLTEDKLKEQNIKDIQKEIENAPDQNDPKIVAKKQELKELLKTRNVQKVESAYQRVQRNPTDPQLRFELGQAYFEAGDYTKAIPELQRCKTNPHLHNRVMLMLGRCYAQKNMLDLARNELEQAKSELGAMDSMKKQVVYELGLIFEKMNDMENSLNCMKEIYQVDYQYRDVAERVEKSYGS